MSLALNHRAKRDGRGRSSTRAPTHNLDAGAQLRRWAQAAQRDCTEKLVAASRRRKRERRLSPRLSGVS
jgi:hypothetical protein